MKVNSLALWVFAFGLSLALFIQHSVDKVWLEQAYLYDVYTNDSGQSAYKYKGQEVIIPAVVPYADSPLNQANLQGVSAPPISQQWVAMANGELKLLKPAFHFGLWSLLPALVTVALCLLTREPISALFSGIVTGALMLGEYNLTDSVIIPNLAQQGSAALLLLYLWLLGGLLGIWSKQARHKRLPK